MKFRFRKKPRLRPKKTLRVRGYRLKAPTLLGKLGLQKMRIRAYYRKKRFWKKEKVPKRVKVNFYTRKKQ